MEQGEAAKLRLCFGSFAEALYKCCRHSGLTREQIGRALLDMIDPTFADGKEASYIYRFINRKRDLPAELKRQKFDPADLQDEFSVFVAGNMTVSYTEAMDAFVKLVTGDDYISEGKRGELLQYKESQRLDLFLSALFVFAVQNTSNKLPPSEMRTRRPALLSQAKSTDNNARLAKIAGKAMDAGDEPALRRCLGKMSNAVYVANTLIVLSRHGIFSPCKALFHEYFSKIANNKYRCQIFEECLRKGYFHEHPGELLEPHFMELANDRYAYDLLVFLCNNGLSGEAERYKDKLTNKTYAKRFAAYLNESRTE